MVVDFVWGVTAPRIIVRGATTALTRRATCRKAFLGPWHPEVARSWLYALAAAQRRTGVAVHHAAVVVNHHHLTVTPSRDNLPEFVRAFHVELSRALNALLEREGYGTPGEVFDGRAPHYMRLLDEGAQASHLVYEHLNTVAAGLVSQPGELPLGAFDFGLWKTGYIEVQRPDVYFDPRIHDEVLRLEVTPPPLLYRAFRGDVDRMVFHMRRVAERGRMVLERVRKRPARGLEALKRLHPWSEPWTPRDTRRSRVPVFRVGAWDRLGSRPDPVRRAATEVRQFREGHARARKAWRQGAREAVFPYGTYAMRVSHGARVAERAPDDALVTTPGPLLEEVRAELACEGPCRGEVRPLLDDVEAAYAAEVAGLTHSDRLLIAVAETTQGESTSTSRARPAPPRRASHPRTPNRAPLPAPTPPPREDQARPKRAELALRHGADPPE